MSISADKFYLKYVYIAELQFLILIANEKLVCYHYESRRMSSIYVLAYERGLRDA